MRNSALVIIDNGSSDDTQLIIKRFVAKFSGAVQQEALTRDSDRELLSSTLKKSNSSRGYPTSVGLALMIQALWSITITVGKRMGRMAGRQII